MLIHSTDVVNYTNPIALYQQICSSKRNALTHRLPLYIRYKSKKMDQQQQNRVKFVKWHRFARRSLCNIPEQINEANFVNEIGNSLSIVHFGLGHRFLQHSPHFYHKLQFTSSKICYI